jgi:hypothetical protein
MKLVIVDRSKTATYERMRELLASDPNVAVIWDRRTPEDRRRNAAQHAPDRRAQERRQKITEFTSRGFIVVDVEEAKTPAASAGTESR